MDPGGRILSGLNNASTEVFNVNNAGDVAATSFRSLGGIDVSLRTDCAANQIMKWTGSVWQCDNDATTGGAGAGDITAVNTAAGTGLQGGVTSGDANLTLLTTCTTGQLLKWNGSAWICDNDFGGLGDITSIITGASSGLLGGVASGDASLTVDFTGSGGDNGTATSVARGDHLHDGRYLQLTGGILSGALSGTTAAFSDFAGGSVLQVSHLGSGSAVAAFNSSTSGFPAIVGTSQAGSNGGVGMRGVNLETVNPGTGVHGLATASPSGTGVLAEGGLFGLDARTSNAGGAAGIFRNSSVTGSILSGRDGSDNEIFNVTAQGQVAATGYFNLAGINISLRSDCASGQIMKWNGTAWACDTDFGGTGDITGVTTAGSSGLLGGVASGDANLSVNFVAAGGDNGIATTVARGDHLHDTRYLMLTGGTLSGALTGTVGTFTSRLIARGTLENAPLGIATPAAGFNSASEIFQYSVFDSTVPATARQQEFRWLAEPQGNNTTTPTGRVKLQWGNGVAAATDTGLSIANTGIITFAAGQTFPGGTGDITDVLTGVGSGLQGGVSSGSANLSLLTTCLSGQILKFIAAAWTCASDDIGAIGTGDITEVLTPAGSGLIGGQTSGSVSLNVNFLAAGGDNGVAATVARGDHLHNAVYLPLTGGTLTGGLTGNSANFSGSLIVDSSTLFVDAATNRVGIGTATPLFPLTVNTVNGFTGAKLGPGSSLYAIANNPILGFNTYYTDTFRYGAAGGAAAIGYNFPVANAIVFGTAPVGVADAVASVTPRMVVLDTGNVGIGTTAPATLLEVAGTVTATSFSGSGAALTGVNASDANLLDGLDSTAFARLTLANSFTQNQTAPRFISTVATGTAPFGVTSATVVTNLNADFLDGLNSTQLARTDIGNTFGGNQNFNANSLFVGSSNQVGIGTGTPTSGFGGTTLHLLGAGNTNVTLEQSGPAAKWNIFLSGADGDLILRNVSDRVSFGTDGRVGIGAPVVVNPTAMLDVRPNVTTTTGVVVRGLASHTANLQEWQNSGGTAVASVSPTGDIKLGSAGALFAPGGEENFRVVAGIVTGAGAVAQGTGFTASRSSVGVYLITFNAAFLDTPIIMITPEGSTARSATILGTSTSANTVRIFDAAGLAIDAQFRFLAFGLR
jgi:hypothetical protein